MDYKLSEEQEKALEITGLYTSLDPVAAEILYKMEREKKDLETVVKEMMNSQ